MAPLLSVVTTVYNKEKYLPKAVESVLAQKFNDYELLLINDGSIDNSAEVVNAYAAKDPRIRAIHKENGGSSSAYNRGIEEAAGKYVLFLDGDDYYEPNALEIVAEQAGIYDFDIIFMNLATSTCDGNQKIINRATSESSMKEDIRVYGKKNIEKAWKSFLGHGLVRNAVNCYKASIIKKHRFRPGIWCSDAFLNIDMANDITSASCHPANLYNGLTYIIDKADLSLNISTGKYYDYNHDAFNNIYWEYVELFSSWGHMDEEALKLISRQRVNGLEKFQLNAVHAFNSPFSDVEKCIELCSYYDELIVSAARVTDQLDWVQRLIIEACFNIFVKGTITVEDSEKYKGHFIIGLITNALKFIKEPSGKLLDNVLKAVTAADNSFRLGIPYYEKLAETSNYIKHKQKAALLRAKEDARYFLIARRLEEAKAHIPTLQENPEDVESCALAICFYMLTDDFENSRRALEAGMRRHPTLGDVVNQMMG